MSEPELAPSVDGRRSDFPCRDARARFDEVKTWRRRASTLLSVDVQVVDRATPWAAFGAWAVMGAGFSTGLLSLMTIGFALVFVFGIGIVALARWRNGRLGSLGVISGASAPALYIAYLNRSGPGTVCTHAATSSSCSDQWSPWPWLVIGALLLVGGLTAFHLAQPRR